MPNGIQIPEAPSSLELQDTTALEVPSSLEITAPTPSPKVGFTPNKELAKEYYDALTSPKVLEDRARERIQEKLPKNRPAGLPPPPALSPDAIEVEKARTWQEEFRPRVLLLRDITEGKFDNYKPATVVENVAYGGLKGAAKGAGYALGTNVGLLGAMTISVEPSQFEKAQQAVELAKNDPTLAEVISGMPIRDESGAEGVFKGAAEIFAQLPSFRVAGQVTAEMLPKVLQSIPKVSIGGVAKGTEVIAKGAYAGVRVLTGSALARSIAHNVITGIPRGAAMMVAQKVLTDPGGEGLSQAAATGAAFEPVQIVADAATEILPPSLKSARYAMPIVRALLSGTAFAAGSAGASVISGEPQANPYEEFGKGFLLSLFHASADRVIARLSQKGTLTPEETRILNNARDMRAQKEANYAEFADIREAPPSFEEVPTRPARPTAPMPSADSQRANYEVRRQEKAFKEAQKKGTQFYAPPVSDLISQDPDAKRRYDALISASNEHNAKITGKPPSSVPSTPTIVQPQKDVAQTGTPTAVVTPRPLTDITTVARKVGEGFTVDQAAQRFAEWQDLSKRVQENPKNFTPEQRSSTQVPKEEVEGFLNKPENQKIHGIVKGERDAWTPREIQLAFRVMTERRHGFGITDQFSNIPIEGLSAFVNKEGRKPTESEVNSIYERAAEIKTEMQNRLKSGGILVIEAGDLAPLFDLNRPLSEIIAEKEQRQIGPPVIESEEGVGLTQGDTGLPEWVSERLAQEGKRGDRLFNDVDLADPKVQDAIKADPTLTEAQKAHLLKTGSLPPTPSTGGEEKSEEPVPQPPTLPHGATKQLGVNSKNEPIYEDVNGVRFKVYGRVRVQAPVEVSPTQRGVEYAPAALPDDFKTKEELKPPVAAPIEAPTSLEIDEGEQKDELTGELAPAGETILEGDKPRALPPVGRERTTGTDAITGSPEGEGNDSGLGGPVDTSGSTPATGTRSGVGDSPSTVVVSSGRNYHITDDDGIGSGSIGQKYKKNIDAIRLVKDLAGRDATPDEQKMLVKYVGWGGMPQAFDEYNREWRQRFDELKAILTPEEYDAARASTPNAHYTAPEVIKALYVLLDRLGYQGGRFLEGALGVGHFFGLMPGDLMAKSKLMGVEMDTISAMIAMKLYPDADIRNKPFQEFQAPDDYFDVSMTNVPFGDIQVYDPDNRLAKFSHSIHNYYIIKQALKVRPGGLLINITSAWTMNSVKATNVRRWLDENMHFLGAVRLPSGAFQENANTKVVTDILVFQKKGEGVKGVGPSWVESTDWKPAGHEYDKPTKLNEYFRAHPEMILGTQKFGRGMYGDGEYIVEPPKGDLGKMLVDLINTKFPTGIYTKQTTKRIAKEVEDIAAPGHVKQGAYHIEGGKLYKKEGEHSKVIIVGVEQLKQIKDLIGVRDALRQVILDQSSDASDAAIASSQKKLNEVYDGYVKKHGRFLDAQNRASRSIYVDDPDYPRLMALEQVNKATGAFEKSDIFTKRTIGGQRAVDRVDNAKDALGIILNELGHFDWERAKQLTGKEQPELEQELAGLIFQTPAGEWQMADEYLAGNVKKKLANAQAILEVDKENRAKWEMNVKALEAVQPKDLNPSEIEARLGATWVPPTDVQDFINETLEQYGRRAISVSFLQNLAAWRVEYSWRDFANNVKATNDFGTEDVYAPELLDDALNGRIPTVYDKHSDGTRSVNKNKTELAREKLNTLKEAFKAWIWADPERSTRLAKKYNDEINTHVRRTFDGSHLTLPGMTQTWRDQLRPLQRNAIWRQLQGMNTLLGHVVGAGKTASMIGAAMEMKRLGLRKKPTFVVPNHALGQWYREIISMYPGANILMTTEKDFKKGSRQILQSKIATGDWDAVLVTHINFGKMKMSDQAYDDFNHEQTSELDDAIADLRAHGEKKGSRIIKQLEKSKQSLEAKLSSKINKKAKDDTITFEELGIDQIFIDEAHNFKNLGFVTKMQRVAGLGGTSSQRATDMFLKGRYINKANNHQGGVVFATGTAVSNTLAELFTMQRYLQMIDMEEHGWHKFDNWAQTFGEVIPTLELATEGSGYRVRNRFARLTNLPELMARFWQVADIATQADIHLPIPEIIGGKPEIKAAPSTPQLRAFLQQLAQRADAIRKGQVEPSEDNMLKISTEGRKAALDFRLIDPSSPDNPDSKVNMAVRDIFAIWEETKADRLTQLVFINYSTPNAEGFNVYDDMKKKLLALGIPQTEIAYIHDAEDSAEKQALFDKVNNGQVRIIMGSVAKMGEGTNIQRRAFVGITLDPPWKPSEMEQMDGRVIRPGNLNRDNFKKGVRIIRYATENSFDAYMYQTLETKARAIGPILSGKIDARSVEDVEGRALTYAEVKAIASGNPLVVDKVRVDMEVQRLERLRSAHMDTQHKLAQEVGTLPSRIDGLKKELEGFQKDLAQSLSYKGKPFEMMIKGTSYDDREVAGKQLVAIGKKMADEVGASKEPVGSFRGFKMVASSWGKGTTLVAPKLDLYGEEGYQANISESSTGTIQSIEYQIGQESLDWLIKRNESTIAELESKLNAVKERIGQPFDKADELNNLLIRQKDLDKQLALDKDSSQGGSGDEEDENVVEGESPSPEEVETRADNEEYQTFDSRPLRLEGKHEKRVILNGNAEPVLIAGEAIQFSGFDTLRFFVWKNPETKDWNVSEGTTGLRMSHDEDKQEAIRLAKDLLEQKGIQETENYIAKSNQLPTEAKGINKIDKDPYGTLYMTMPGVPELLASGKALKAIFEHGTTEMPLDGVRFSDGEMKIALKKAWAMSKVFPRLLSIPMFVGEKYPGFGNIWRDGKLEAEGVWGAIDRLSREQIEFVRTVDEDVLHNWKDADALSDSQWEVLMDATRRLNLTDLMKEDIDDFTIGERYNVSGPVLAVYKQVKEALGRALELRKQLDRFLITNGYFKPSVTQLRRFLKKRAMQAAGINMDQITAILEVLSKPAAEVTTEQMKALWALPQIKKLVADGIIDRRYAKKYLANFFPLNRRPDHKFFVAAREPLTEALDDALNALANELDMPEEADEEKPQLYFANFGTAAEANKHANELARNGYFPPEGEDAIVAYHRDNIPTGIRRALSPEQLFDLAEAAGIDHDNPVLRQMVEEIYSRGFDLHFIERQRTPGFQWTKENYKRNVVDYVDGSARKFAKRVGKLTARRRLEDLKKTKQLPPQIVRYAEEWLNSLDASSPMEWALLRQGIYMTTLGLSVSNMVQNFTQPLVTTYNEIPVILEGSGKPYGPTTTEHIFFSAYKDALTYSMMHLAKRLGRRLPEGTHLPAHWLELAEKAARQGVINPLQLEQLAALSEDPRVAYPVGSKVTRKAKLAWRALNDIVSIGQRISETTNRNHAFMVGLAIGERYYDLRGKDLYEFAVRLVQRTQFQFGTHNLPLLPNVGQTQSSHLVRPLMRLMLILRGFMLNQFSRTAGTLRSKNVGAIGRYFGMLLTLAGLRGVVGYGIFMGLYSFYLWLRGDEEPAAVKERRLFKGIEEKFGLPDRTLSTGPLGVVTGIETSRILGFGDFPQFTMQDLTGVAGSLGKRAGYAYDAFKEGRIAAGAQQLPFMVRGTANVLRGKEAAKEGIISRGRVIVRKEDITPSDITKLSLGFTPTHIAQAYEENKAQATVGQAGRDKYNTSIDTYVRALVSGDNNQASKTLNEVIEWNTTHGTEEWIDLKRFITDAQIRVIDENLRARTYLKREELRQLYQPPEKK